MTVLVLTRDFDPVADLAIGALNKRGVPVHRLDPGDFPQALTLAASIDSGSTSWRGTIRGQHRDLSLADVHAVYWRRPSKPRIRPGLGEDDTAWAQAEAYAGLVGTLASLDCLWVNRPDRNRAAESKPGALAAAVRCGLPVPRTLITNDPVQARAFVNGLPGAVAAYKSLGDRHPGDRDGRPQALWTNRIRAVEIDDSTALTAHQWQEWIDKAYEVRLTVVGERLFAAEIHAGSDLSRVDFRRDYDHLAYKPCSVPAQVADGVLELLDLFDLRYAALDFLVSHDGRWYLVDLNPNGQYGFIADLRDPIAEALADLLEGPRR